MAGKRAPPAGAAAKGSSSSTSTKTRSHAASASTRAKPSLLGMKLNPPPMSKGKAKRAAQKAKDADTRHELDGGNLAGLRQALVTADKNKPLIEKKQAPAELAKGGDPLAQSMDEVLDLLGTS